MFDQEPLTTAALVAPDSDEHPASLQSISVQHELEIAAFVAFAQSLLAAAILRLVRAAVPQHHRSAAVLPLGNRALEAVVLHRVIFDLHGESLHRRVIAR